MNVSFSRSRKVGPEIIMEDTVIDRLPTLFPQTDYPFWAGASLSIGSSVPDILIAAWKPQLSVLSSYDKPIERIMGYLRSIRRATGTTIANRLNIKEDQASLMLGAMTNSDILDKQANSYSLKEHWRDILPEIISIEVKVSNWKKAIMQATRNRVFVHRSYIALPERIASRIQVEAVFAKLGIGLISVNSDNRVEILRMARRNKPKYWYYYYSLANHIASEIN